MTALQTVWCSDIMSKNEMLEDTHLEELHDFPVTDDCFPGVNIRGGVCYFLWSRDKDNSSSGLKVVTHEKNNAYSIVRPLKYVDTRVNEQVHTVGVPFKIHLRESAMRTDGTLRSHARHRSGIRQR